MNIDKISLAIELIELCLVPELITDIDAQQIEAEHFKEFKQILDQNLHLLFDLLQQYENVLFDQSTETEVFRKKFIILLCEQSAESVPYKSDQLVLQQNVTYLTGKWFRKIVSDKSIFELVLQYYKTRVKVDVWKKNIGAIFGFHRFCQLNYTPGSVLQMSEMFFVLATGTLLLEHCEPMYKQMGIDLYLILMTFSNKSDILSSNIHHAVHATCSANVQKVRDYEINLRLWKCLYKCIEMDNSWQRTSDWHKIDELMMDLLQRIAFEGNIRRSTILFHYAAKFGALSHPKRFIVDGLNEFSGADAMNRESLVNIDWALLRSEYQKVDSFIIYKWVKKMLLLIGNQNVLFGDDFEVAFNLQAIHFTYIVWFLSIPLTLVSTPMLDMLTKFVPTLLDCHRRYRGNELVCGEIRQLIGTFLQHFSMDDKSSWSKNVKLAKRFETLQLIKSSIG